MMRWDSRNLLIIVMFLIIVAMMILTYKVNTLVVDRIPDRVEPEVYVLELTEAIERQNQFSAQQSYTIRWLRRHLDHCLTLIESERGLEPIAIQYPDTGLPHSSGGYSLNENSEPFVIPYEKPKREMEPPQKEKDLRYLTCLVNLNAVNAAMSMYAMDNEAINLQERLKRISPDPNTLKPQEAIDTSGSESIKH